MSVHAVIMRQRRKDHQLSFRQEGFDGTASRTKRPSNIFSSGLTTLVVGLLLPILTGCNPPAENAGAEGTTSTGGSLKIEGSNTLLPLAEKWAEGFKAKNAAANISVAGGGSGQGITALINGTTDIANASRPAKDEEKEKAKTNGFEMVETAVANDGITIIVHPTNTVKSLTVGQLKDIFTGKVKNWNEVGGPDLKIVASGRDSSSGTYEYFLEEVLKKEKYRADMLSTPSNNKIADNVAAQKGGIGYIGVAYASEFTKAGKVKELPIAFEAGQEPVLPTEENILSRKYPISRALYNYTKGQPSGVAKEYLDFVTGPEGQKIVSEVGYVPLKK